MSTDQTDHTELDGITEDEAGQLLAGKGGQKPRTPGEAAQGAQEASDRTPGGEEDAGDAPAGGEAAKWRHKLRSAEAERDQLRERLATMQRAEIERLASEHMVKSADLWVLGTDLGALLSEDGQVDVDKVAGTVEAIVAERPTWSRNPRQPVPGKPRERLRGGGDPYRDRSSGSWSEILGQR